MSKLATLGSISGYYFTDTDSIDTLVSALNVIVEVNGNSPALFQYTNKDTNFNRTFQASMTDYWWT